MILAISLASIRTGATGHPVGMLVTYGRPAGTPSGFGTAGSSTAGTAGAGTVATGAAGTLAGAAWSPASHALTRSWPDGVAFAHGLPASPFGKEKPRAFLCHAPPPTSRSVSRTAR